MSSTTPASSGRRWDGAPIRTHRLRSLRLSESSPSRLLCTAQASRCRDCGNRITWHDRTDHRPIAMHPQELPAAAVPLVCRWHIDSGIAHPAGDGSPWCRIPHTVLCPARSASTLLTPQLTALRRRLALHTRRLTDTGTFTPPLAPTEPRNPTECRPARPVVQLLYGRYLAATPLDDIQCVAQTRTRRRCTQPVLDPTTKAGIWKLLPATPARGQLTLPATSMAVYDLSHLPYSEQLRWRTQRCPRHATTPGAPDLALTGWEVLDPLLHHPHIHTRLPDTARRRGNGQQPCHRRTPARQEP
ncbi:DUF6083 domain-containing protein [Streptomyces sp. NPDC047980]|uniref:DUF6083 domain-containing protein n=1 Tax=Streptomyces sp. NPDC047980 TaxID=3365494 RepID=UPI003716636C